MPRTSKTVAQRLGTPSKSRRRRFQRADEVDAPLQAATVAPPLPSARVEMTRVTAAPIAPRTPTARRRYVDYAADYAYVPGDLRRIVVVSGGLLVLLLALSLVIR
jgi:hypothetical protein